MPATNADAPVCLILINYVVSLDEVDRHKEQGRLFEIHIDVKAPQAEIVATRQRHEDAYVALDDAFDAATRQIQDTLDRQRGDVKNHQAGREDNPP